LLALATLEEERKKGRKGKRKGRLNLPFFVHYQPSLNRSLCTGKREKEKRKGERWRNMHFFFLLMSLFTSCLQIRKRGGGKVRRGGKKRRKKGRGVLYHFRAYIISNCGVKGGEGKEKGEGLFMKVMEE